MKRASTLLRQIVLGKNTFILSYVDFKRAFLTGQLALITFLTCSVYIVYDLNAGIHYAWPYQIGCGLAALISFVLNRNKKHLLAKVVLGLAVNFTVFLFASSEPQATGLSAFFIVVCLGTLAGFGYEERKLAFIFIGITTALCLITLLTDFHLITIPSVPDGYIRSNLIANVVTCTITAILIIYFLLNANFRSEMSLRESEQKLMTQNEELIKLNTELDRFVYSSSHDLRAPLSSMLGLIQVAELSNNADELKNYILLMKDRVQHLDKFVKDITEYSRNSRSKVQSTSLSLKRVVREVLESLQFYPGTDKITIEVDIDEDLTIVTDETRLKIILNNIASNCLKYFDGYKSESKILIQANEQEHIIEILVKDNGIGIPAELLPKIFDMFFQAHEKSIGSGLGLYIVKEAVQKLEGTIEARSELGIETEFKIRLPKKLSHAHVG